MTSPWTRRPSNLFAPGHANRGDEGEEVLDQIEFLSSGYPGVLKIKTADTSRSSANVGTTYTDDPDLAVSGLAANGVYVVEIEMNITIGAGGFKYQNTAPAGSTFECISFIWNNGTVTFANAWKRITAGGTPGAATAGHIPGADGGAPYRLRYTLFVGSTPGVLAFQWAQDSSNAANTTVVKGSWMRLTRAA